MNFKQTLSILLTILVVFSGIIIFGDNNIKYSQIELSKIRQTDRQLLYDFMVQKGITEYHLSQWRSNFIVSVIFEEYDNVIYQSIDPLLIYSLMIVESSLKNVYGDSGDAVGFFQLHRESVEYVTRFYPEYNKLLKLPHKNLIKYLRSQIEIGIRYLYLINKYIYNGNIRLSIDRWNGYIGEYGNHSMKVFDKYSQLIHEFRQYRLDKLGKE